MLTLSFIKKTHKKDSQSYIKGQDIINDARSNQPVSFIIICACTKFTITHTYLTLILHYTLIHVYNYLVTCFTLKLFSKKKKSTILSNLFTYV